MKFTKNLLNNLPMRTKLLLSFSLVVCIPLLVCIYLMNSMKNNVMDTAIEDATNSMERVNIRLSQMFDSVTTISSEIAYNESYYNLINATYSSDFEKVASIWSSANLSEYITLSNNNIEDIRYYVDQVPVLDNGYFINTPDNIRDSSWYTACSSEFSAPFWTYLNNPRFLKRDTKNLAFIRPVYYKQQFFAVLTLYLNQEKINEILALENYQTLLLSPKDIVVASSSRELLGRHVSELGLTKETDSFLSDGSLYPADTVILSDTLSPEDSSSRFQIITILPSAIILEKVSETNRTSIIIMVITSTLSVLFLILFSNLLTHRLSKLQEDIHRAADGDLSIHPVIDGTDEIAQLSVDFEKMLNSIQELIDRVYLSEIQKQKLESKQKEIKLQVLSSQINPHFLFNALESIRMKAVSTDQGEIGTAILMLSSLLRKSLYAGSDPIPLKDELELIENYLKLQQFRFPNGFSYNILSLCDIENQYLPPFTLQPLVENSFRHGFESTNSPHRKNFVTITIMKEGDFLIIQIADNGKGIDADHLAEITESLSAAEADTSHGHIGICNVHQRIALIYGPEYDISIKSELHKGCVITIRLPYQSE